MFYRANWNVAFDFINLNSRSGAITFANSASLTPWRITINKFTRHACMLLCHLSCASPFDCSSPSAPPPPCCCSPSLFNCSPAHASLTLSLLLSPCFPSLLHWFKASSSANSLRSSTTSRCFFISAKCPAVLPWDQRQNMRTLECAWSRACMQHQNTQ